MAEAPASPERTGTGAGRGAVWVLFMKPLEGHLRHVRAHRVQVDGKVDGRRLAILTKEGAGDLICALEKAQE